MPGAIAGSMAEAKWGVPEEIEREALGRLDKALLKTFESFTGRYPR
jgi:ADP-ribosylglycohydrolase